MAAFTTIAAVVGAGASLASYGESRKAAAAQAEAVGMQKRAAAEQQKAQEVSYRRQQRAAIRQAQLSRAQSLVSGTAVGGAGGSGLAGGLSGLGSQLGENLGFGSQLSGINANIGMFNQQAMTYGAQAASHQQRASALGSIGSTLFNFGASRGGLDFLLPAPTGTGVQVPSYTQ